MTSKSAAPAKPSERKAAAKPVPVYATEGQRLFCELPGTVAGLAERLKAHRQSIEQWRAGERTPSPKAREKIADAYKIPPAAWERIPLGAAPPDSEDEPDEDEDVDADADTDEDEDEETDGHEPTLLEDCLSQIRYLRKQLKRGDMLARERIVINDALGRALNQRAKFEREVEMQEDRLVRNHPAWRRLKRVIIDALLPHPAAARAVEEAINSVLGEDEP